MRELTPIIILIRNIESGKRGCAGAARGSTGGGGEGRRGAGGAAVDEVTSRILMKLWLVF